MSSDAAPVDVVLPTLNCAAQLERCLAAVGEQRYAGSVRLLVVDGGSRDDTVAVARRHGAEVFERPGEYATGLTGSRHFGETQGRSPLLWLLDADNVPVGPDVLPRLAAPLAADPEVSLSVPLLDVPAHEVPFARWLAWVEEEALEAEAARGVPTDGYRVVDELRHGVSNGTLVRRAALEAAGGYDSDVRLLNRLRRLGRARAALVPQARIVHDQVRSPGHFLRKASARVVRFGAMGPDELRRYFAEYPVPPAVESELHSRLESGFVRAPTQAFRGWWRTGDRSWGWGLTYPFVVGAVALRHPLASYRVYRRFL